MSDQSCDYSQRLHQYMQSLGISSFKQLRNLAGVSQGQILRLRRGEINQMRLEVLLKLSQVLEISLDDLRKQFSPQYSQQYGESVTLKQEYERLQEKMAQQREELSQEFQLASLEILESWLIYWSAAAAAAKDNPQLPAVRLLPLVKPVEQLVAEWGVEMTAYVGEEVAYNPQVHDLLAGVAQPGELVRIRNAGYKYGGKLLHRAKVSPVES